MLKNLDYFREICVRTISRVRRLGVSARRPNLPTPSPIIGSYYGPNGPLGDCPPGCYPCFYIAVWGDCKGIISPGSMFGRSHFLQDASPIEPGSKNQLSGGDTTNLTHFWPAMARPSPTLPLPSTRSSSGTVGGCPCAASRPPGMPSVPILRGSRRPQQLRFLRRSSLPMNSRPGDFASASASLCGRGRHFSCATGGIPSLQNDHRPVAIA